MSVPKHNSIAQFLNLLKSKGETKQRKTINKSAPKVARNDEHHRELAPAIVNDDSSFPGEYYTPRPTPKTFVVGEVRKVSTSGDFHCFSNVNCGNVVSSPVLPSGSNPTSVESYHAHSPAIDHPKSRSNRNSGPNGCTCLEVPLTNGVNRSTAGPHPLRPNWNLLLGQQNPDSPYLQRQYFRVPYLADAKGTFGAPDEVLYHVPEIDPHAFEIYKTYARTGRIGFKYPETIKPEHLWIATWPLMNAFILGCIIEEPDFADRVIDTLVGKLTPDVSPDVETVNHLFEGDRKGIPEILKKLVVDWFVSAQERASQVIEASRYPASFQSLALQVTLRRLFRRPRTKVPSSCTYHTHGTKEPCYKTKLTLVDILKERKLAGAREESKRDAEIVAANIAQNGIKSIDWEQRRADAHQALRIKTEVSWIGVRRPVDRKHENQSLASKDAEAHNNPDSGQASHEQQKPLMTNGMTSDRSLTSTPNGSPVQSNGGLPNGSVATAVLHTESFAHDRHAPDPVELEGNSIANRSQLTNPDWSHRSSLDQILYSRNQSVTKMVGIEGVNGTGTSVYLTNDSASATSSNTDEAISEYERYKRCPGAYPESNCGA